MRPLLPVFLIGLCVLFAQEGGEKEDTKNPFAGKPEAITAGRKLFVDGCSGCHGPNAEGGRGPNLASADTVRIATNARLFASIKNGVKGTDMPPANVSDDKIWQMIAFLRNISSPAFESNVAGNAEAGAELFWGKAQCGSCHMIRGRGGYLGPDLSNAGRLRSVAQLMESILKPNERIAYGFQAATVTMDSGEKISGVARDNTNYAIQILDAQGQLHLLDKRKIKEVVFRHGSPMPKDYGKRLSPEQVQNLVAFLAKQSMRTGQAEEVAGTKNR